MDFLAFGQHSFNDGTPGNGLDAWAILIVVWFAPFICEQCQNSRVAYPVLSTSEWVNLANIIEFIGIARPWGVCRDAGECGASGFAATAAAAVAGVCILDDGFLLPTDTHTPTRAYPWTELEVIVVTRCSIRMQHKGLSPSFRINGVVDLYFWLLEWSTPKLIHWWKAAWLRYWYWFSI